MFLVISFWVIGFILSALAFYHKDMRGKYVSGTDLMIKFFICLIPSLNLIFGIAYFISEAIGWCIDNFGRKCGRLIWDRTGFKWIVNKETNDE